MNNRAHVLVVDDDPDVRGLVRSCSSGRATASARPSNGGGAAGALRHARPTIVLLDVTMPELDGWQTLERIRDLTDVPVLMLTARAAELEKVRGLKAGADDYVTQAVRPPGAARAVEALLRRAPGPARRRRRRTPTRVLQVDFADAQRLGERRGGRSSRRSSSGCSRPSCAIPARSSRATSSSSSSGATVSASRRPGEALRRLPAPQARGSPGSTRRLIETVRGFGYRYRP